MSVEDSKHPEEPTKAMVSLGAAAENVAVGVAKAVTGPIGGILQGLLGHPHRQLQEALAANFEAFVWDTFKEQNERLKEGDEQFKEIRDEHEQQRHLIDWLQEQLGDVNRRLENVEQAVLGKVLYTVMENTATIWLNLSDPEMYAYLRAAMRSLVLRRHLFRGSASSLLLENLRQLESDQIRMLSVIWEEEQAGGLTSETYQQGFGHLRHANRDHLLKLGLLSAASKRCSFRAGRSPDRWVTPRGHELLRFIEIVPQDSGYQYELSKP